MTTELMRMTHRRRGSWWVVAGLALTGAALGSLQCGPKPPPPHIVEVPIDQYDNGPRPAESAPTPEPSASVAVVTETSAGGGNGSRPSALATQPQPASGPPPGQRLTAAECDKVLDKGAIQYGLSKQMSVSRAMRSIPALRTQAQADTTFAQVTSGCTQQNSKTQYGCAMKSTSFDKWKGCFEAAP